MSLIFYAASNYLHLRAKPVNPVLLITTNLYLYAMSFCLRKIVPGLLLLAALPSFAQVHFSVATDMGLLRNFSPKQKFWAIGQTVIGNFHINKRETVYAWLTYYSPGRFRNNFTATAKSPSTSPSTSSYRVTGTWRFREVSVGWKHYFKGAFNEENTWSLYSIAGLGVMFNKVENRFKQAVDTSLYSLAILPLEGSSVFNRLTLDLGLGLDFPIGADIYVYSDVRSFVPITDYPSLYLHQNKNVPLPFMVNIGFRFLFDWSY